MRGLRLYAMWLTLWTLFVPMSAMAVMAKGTPPNVLVHKKTTQILHLIEVNRGKYKRDKQALYAMVDQNIVPYFDFKRMSRWVLARYWRTASAAEREAFTTQFRALLVRTYATALLSYSGQRIAYLPYRENPQSRHAEVRTEVIENNGGSNIPIDYMFVHQEGGWKVYDVTIDGVSLVTNYRSVYASKVRHQGLDALIASMKRVNERDS